MTLNPELVKAAGYAAAWSSNNPENVAGHFLEEATVQINGGVPLAGREAIAQEYAAPFFDDFPGCTVLMHDFRLAGSHALFTGMLVCDLGFGQSVRLLGWEEWTLHDSGEIVQSLVWFDQKEYDRQIRRA